MLVLKQTDVFARWRRRIKDARVRAAIASRLDRLAYGHEGDAKPIGGGVSELRIHHGPGYRIYFHRHGRTLVILLCGGHKASQTRDIEAARRLLAKLETERNEPDDV